MTQIPPSITTVKAKTGAVLVFTLVGAALSVAAAMTELLKSDWYVVLLVVVAIAPWFTLMSRAPVWRWVLVAFIAGTALSAAAIRVYFPDKETSNVSSPAMIVSPVSREQVGHCATIRGFVWPRGGASYWLVIRRDDAFSDYFLAKRIEVATEEAQKWDLAKVPIGDPKDDGEFHLLIVSTDSDRTREWTDRLGRNDWNLGRELPAGPRIEDDVVVARTSSGC